MTTLTEFYALVSAECRRGSAFDSQIPRKVQQALNWMESQHTFRHMEHYASVSIDHTLSEPRAIAIPTGFKKMVSWRYLLTDNDETVYVDLPKIDFYDVSRIKTDRPNGYWQDGMDYFWLDNTPDQTYSSEMAYVAKTTLPASASEEPYVIQQFDNLLLTETMVLMAPLLRDPRVVQLYKPQRDELMKAAIDEDVEGRQSWQSQSVQYGHDKRNNINLEGIPNV